MGIFFDADRLEEVGSAAEMLGTLRAATAAATTPEAARKERREMDEAVIEMFFMRILVM
jgi:hypothetical protein